MINDLCERLNRNFGEDSATIINEGLQQTILVNKDKLKDICLWLRDTNGFYFDFLSSITAVDYFPKNEFAVVYNLSSIVYQYQLTLKVLLPNGRALNDLPEIDSVSAIWRTADWHEREAFDLMGIFFVGHPDLRRILLPDDWIGFPLRKDYTEAEMYRGISTTS